MSEDEQKLIFSSNLRHYIELNGKSQKEIAKDIGTSPQNVNNWVKGVSLPRMGTIQALADYFRISTTDLIDNRKDDSPEAKKLLDIIMQLSTEDIAKLRAYIDFLKKDKELEDIIKNNGLEK